jgi:hypothetical protein
VSPRMERALTVGCVVVVVLLLMGLGGLGAGWVKAGLWGFGVIMVVGAISLVRGGRVGDDDHRPVGDRADDPEPSGLGGGDRGDRGGVRAGASGLGSDAAWRAWLDEMEERER